MDLSSVFDIPSHVVAREVMGEVVLLDLGSGQYFGLDPVGARIWELASEGQALAGVADRIVAEFDVARDVAEADILRLATELAERDLVRVAAKAGPDG